ncbi:hypothetical protein ACTMTI_56700, partial [Nonomuraea sp. H19]|uniref:hypothetical protein n=1 Tax=Nonomuraea sp. H19 TaxID=3452206 RepID=UPI003F8BEC9D
MLRVELQQDREAESRGVALAGDEVALFVQDRPVLDQRRCASRGVSCPPSIDQASHSKINAVV